MSTVDHLPQASHAVLAQSMATLAQGAPGLVDDPSILGRLEDLAKELQATAPASMANSPTTLTLTNALTLTATAQHLVALLVPLL